MKQCPKCDSPQIHRSRSRTRWESWRREITGKRPFRCPACGWRGWGADTGPEFADDEIEIATQAIAPDPPNLRRVVVSMDEARVADIDVKALDNVTEAPDPRRKRRRRESKET